MDEKAAPQEPTGNDDVPLWAALSLVVGVVSLIVSAIAWSVLGPGVTLGRVPIDVQTVQFAKSSPGYAVVTAQTSTPRALFVLVPLVAGLLLGIVGLIGAKTRNRTRR